MINSISEINNIENDFCNWHNKQSKYRVTSILVIQVLFWRIYKLNIYLSWQHRKLKCLIEQRTLPTEQLASKVVDVSETSSTDTEYNRKIIIIGKRNHIDIANGLKAHKLCTKNIAS